MADLGLGGCLADDMGLGKTIQLIALHLHLQRAVATGGRYAGGLPDVAARPTGSARLTASPPASPVRRYHGGRPLASTTSAGDEIVLATYGVVRRDADATGRRWRGACVVADEAQA